MMIRKTFSRVLFAVAFFTLGMVSILATKYYRGIWVQDETKNVLLQQNYLFAKLQTVVWKICTNIYPKPNDDATCFDSILDHGIEKSFDSHTAYLSLGRVKEERARERGGNSIVKLIEKPGFKIIEDPQIEASILMYSDKFYGFIRTHRFEDHFTDELRQKVSELMNAKKKLSGLIISVENNPGGVLSEVNNALDLFMDQESFVLKQNRLGIKAIDTDRLMHTPGDITNGIPMLVVINNESASASEIFAGAMKHFGRALIYGERTFGKGTIQNYETLFDGAELRVTVAEYLIGTMKDWVPVQCVGIIPDIVRKNLVSQEKDDQFECMDEASIASVGPMLQSPKHSTFSEIRPNEYQIGLLMIKAYELTQEKSDK